jgi:hypothetical protein
MKKVWGNCERRGVNYCALALSSTLIFLSLIRQ